MYRYKPTNLPTVIIKRRRRDAAPVSHSGAWKVAYADFVTAMMSFFLLLWLLSVTTTAQRSAISSYFGPESVSAAPNGAGGVLGGQSIIEPGQRLSSAVPLGLQAPAPGQPDTSRRKDSENDPADGQKRADAGTGGPSAGGGSGSAETQAAREEQQFQGAEASLRQAIQSMPDLQPLARNLIVDQTPEGLRIQIVDQDGASMFALGSADMYDHTKKLLALVERSVSGLPNTVSIRGHTDANPYRGAAADRYDNWDLSTDRANASRRALEAAGLQPSRIIEVIGKADTDPLFPDKPLSSQNRRISIILLRSVPKTP